MLEEINIQSFSLEFLQELQKQLKNSKKNLFQKFIVDMLEEINIQNCSLKFLKELKQQLKNYEQYLLKEIENLQNSNNELYEVIEENNHLISDDDEQDYYWDITDENEMLEDDIYFNNQKIKEKKHIISQITLKIYEIDDELYFR